MSILILWPSLYNMYMTQMIPFTGKFQVVFQWGNKWEIYFKKCKTKRKLDILLINVLSIYLYLEVQ